MMILLLHIAVGGCDDFLENPPLGLETQDNFPSTQSDAILAVNGVYNTLRIWFFHEGGYPILDFMSDDGRKGSNPGDQSGALNAYQNFTFGPAEQSFSRWWNTLYQGIKRSHLVLERMPAIQMDNNLKLRLEAETRFLRALFYFNLVTAWGDVPKITQFAVPTEVSRAPAQEIYDEIILPDLLFAIEHLLEKSEYPESESGRATKGAAKAYLARVYLYLGDFVNAELFALEVIESGEYILPDIFSDDFSVDNEHGSGSVFEISAIPEGSVGAGGNQYGNAQGVRGMPNLGWGFGRPSYDLIQFLQGDPRFEGTVILPGQTIDGVTIFGDPGTPDTTWTDPTRTEILEIESYNRKVFVAGDAPRYSWGHNRRMFRYAEVLLIAAEALNENNKSADALIHLNTVRERARGGDPDILPDILTTNQSDLRDLIFEERRRELALEGHRFYDLLRSGKALEILGPAGFTVGKHELLPVPQEEIDLSGGTLTQNPGW